MATIKKKVIAENKEALNEETKATSKVDIYAEEEVFTLLAGYEDSEGVVHKEFTLREITGRDEEALGKPDIKANASKAISLLLSRCVTSIGTLRPENMKTNEWNNIIKNLYTGDQDYMMLQLRKISIGEEIQVTHECNNPNCGVKLHTTIEIDEIELNPFKGERIVRFELPKGFTDRKGNLCTKGELRIPNGLDREILLPLAKNNLARATTAMLTRICKFDTETPITQDTISDLTKRDREYLNDLLQEHSFGLVLETEVVCDVCGSSFRGTFSTTNFI